MRPEISSKPVRLAVFASHPIQYQVPWFTALSDRAEIDLRVYYSLIPDPELQGIGFDVPFTWDIPLLEGYRWECLPSVFKNPSLEGFFSNPVRRLSAFLREDRPDVAIITGWHCIALVQALFACRKLHIPCIVRGESNAIRSRPRWKRLLQRLWLRRYSAFLTIGKSSRDFYLDHGVDQERLFDCPYFVDNERFRSEAEALSGERRAIRAEWSIPPNATCFLFAGKLVPKKRPLDLLNAVRVASRNGSPIHLLVVGAGALLEECRRITERDALPVTFAGFQNQSEIARAYVASDCLVLPSDDGETWGLVVNEAMACGRPAIVSDRVGCGPDLVEPGATGFVFPLGDFQALAETLVAAAGDRAALLRMGERGRQRVFSDYSVEQAVTGTLSAVEAVLASGR